MHIRTHAQAIDVLALHLPSKHVLPEALAYAQQAVRAGDPLQRAAACTVIVDLAEGCADAVRKQLPAVLQVGRECLHADPAGAPGRWTLSQIGACSSYSLRCIVGAARHPAGRACCSHTPAGSDCFRDIAMHAMQAAWVSSCQALLKSENSLRPGHILSIGRGCCMASSRADGSRGGCPESA